jgi:hypothetical protein
LEPRRLHRGGDEGRMRWPQRQDGTGKNEGC